MLSLAYNAARLVGPARLSQLLQNSVQQYCFSSFPPLIRPIACSEIQFIARFLCTKALPAQFFVVLLWQERYPEENQSLLSGRRSKALWN